MGREFDVMRRETKRHSQEGILLGAQTHNRWIQVQMHLHGKMTSSACESVCGVRVCVCVCVCACASVYACDNACIHLHLHCCSRPQQLFDCVVIEYPTEVGIHT